MIEISTPALLFPAISLLLLAFTNRFLTTGQLIRQLKARPNTGNYDSTRKQIRNLQRRLSLIIFMQTVGVASILFCTISMMFLFAGNEKAGQTTFATSLVLMVISLIVSLWEILISGQALKIELNEMGSAQQNTEHEESTMSGNHRLSSGI